ncbi:MAG: hypothetical protein J6Y02_11290 [Pseudobutyrivibrio sp.]|nr:hypothetical protein [Pseudobutyrivibrio sp.]
MTVEKMREIIEKHPEAFREGLRAGMAAKGQPMANKYDVLVLWSEIERLEKLLDEKD